MPCSDFSRLTIDPVQSVMNSDTLLSSWQVPDLDEQHSCHISSGVTQQLGDQDQQGRQKMTSTDLRQLSCFD